MAVLYASQPKKMQRAETARGSRLDQTIWITAMSVTQITEMIVSSIAEAVGVVRQLSMCVVYVRATASRA